MGNNYSAFIEPRRRGQILQVLAQSNEHGCNVPLLRSVVRQSGYRVSDESLAIDLSFLADNGFLRMREVGGMQLAILTVRGRDVVTGNLTVPGIDCTEPEG